MEKCDSLHTHIDLQVSQYDVHSPRENRSILLEKEMPLRNACGDEKCIQVSFRILHKWRPFARPRHR